MDVKFDKDTVTITIPCSADTIKKAGLTKSEKNKNIATTGGFVAVQGSPGLKLNLSLVAPK